jgi:hypothetical protein
VDGAVMKETVDAHLDLVSQVPILQPQPDWSCYPWVEAIASTCTPLLEFCPCHPACCPFAFTGRHTADTGDLLLMR